jgi:tetratricopeptide (TPR) repeat protein
MSTAADSIELDYRRGNALRMSGAFAQAETALREVLRRAPGHRDAAYSLAHMLREDGRLNAAANVIAALWKNASHSAEEALAALAFLSECGAQSLAQTIAQDARARWPDDARLAAQAGEISLALGAFEEAAMALREALDRDPAQSASWLRLAYCRRFANRDETDVRRFARGWADTQLDAAAHVCAGFALGKALDDLGDYARAADVLRGANALAHAASPWRSHIWRTFVETRLHAVAPASLRADPAFVPVFIVGLPRTGTTLVATALGRHPDVRDRGELNWIGALHAHLQAQGQLHDARALATVAQLVRAQMRRDDAPAQFYIDKNPLNFRHLDFIASLFPNARIIHCRRASRDTALSLWMQHFAHEDLGFSYDFSTIAEVEEGYRQLMAHWHRSLGIRLLDLDYETFVAQPEQQLQRLAVFLGIADSARASSHAHADAVTTASVWQVRQPIYTHAVERWRRYAPYLPELAALFAEEGAG